MTVNLVKWNAVLAVSSVDFQRFGEAIGGPVTLTGNSVPASLDTGYWMARLDLALLDSGIPVLAARALRAELQGGVHHVLVPTFDQGQAPWPAAGGRVANENPDETFSDGTYFSDGTGFFSPAIMVYVAEDAAQNTTRLVVDVEAAGTIRAGMYFSIGQRLYEVRRVISSTESPLQYTLAILPRLREAVTVGDTCEFERPVCRMRLLSEGDARLVLRHLWRVTDASWVMVEAFDP